MVGGAAVFRPNTEHSELFQWSSDSTPGTGCTSHGSMNGREAFIAGLQTGPWVDRLRCVMLYCHISLSGDMSVYALFLVAVTKHQPKGLFLLTEGMQSLRVALPRA